MKKIILMIGLIITLFTGCGGGGGGGTSSSTTNETDTNTTVVSETVPMPPVVNTNGESVTPPITNTPSM